MAGVGTGTEHAARWSGHPTGRAPRPRAAPWLAALTTGALLVPALAGCGGGATPDVLADGAAQSVATAQRAALRQGGSAGWAIDRLPTTLNAFQYEADEVTEQIAAATLPTLFTIDAQGQPQRNPDYLRSAEITAREPKQQVVYTLHPDAAWNDGKPITVDDFIAQWKALKGDDHAYWSARAQGYDRVEKIAEGPEPHQVEVTFAQPYAEWRSLFSPLYPAGVTGDPERFNEGLRTELPVSAGPFRIDSLDEEAGTVTLARDDAWWGDPALLDELVLTAVPRAQRRAALLDGTVDIAEVTPADANRIDAAGADQDDDGKGEGLGENDLAAAQGPSTALDALHEMATARLSGEADSETADQRYAAAVARAEQTRERTFATREEALREQLSGFTVHRAYHPSYTQLTLNGSSELLADEQVRWAVARALDREKLAKDVHGPAGLPVRPLGSHVRILGQHEYQDNSEAIGDAGARRPADLLDEVGWRHQAADAADPATDGKSASTPTHAQPLSPRLPTAHQRAALLHQAASFLPTPPTPEGEATQPADPAVAPTPAAAGLPAQDAAAAAGTAAVPARAASGVVAVGGAAANWAASAGPSPAASGMAGAAPAVPGPSGQDAVVGAAFPGGATSPAAGAAAVPARAAFAVPGRSTRDAAVGVTAIVSRGVDVAAVPARAASGAVAEDAAVGGAAANRTVSAATSRAANVTAASAVPGPSAEGAVVGAAAPGGAPGGATSRAANAAAASAVPGPSAQGAVVGAAAPGGAPSGTASPAANATAASAVPGPSAPKAVVGAAAPGGVTSRAAGATAVSASAAPGEAPSAKAASALAASESSAQEAAEAAGGAPGGTVSWATNAPAGGAVDVPAVPGPSAQDTAQDTAQDVAEEAVREVARLEAAAAAPVRAKDGEELSLRFVVPDGADAEPLRRVAGRIAAMLATAGIGTEFVEAPAEEFFDGYVVSGAFDLALYSWPATAFPATDATPLFTKPQSIPGGQLLIEQNYARVGTDHIDQLLDRAAGELDESEYHRLLDQADARIWAAAGSLPLFQRPQLVAVNGELAGVGAFGLATPRFQDIGFRA
ncbi:ABC transporter substrate-binding protein [Streptomyces sp. NBRC 109706]|uniref:ABC transporter substrate-binding protein n=1 Tax=Streptomyces sp. NBRC 109706 TaxID=1550035 RepID=UPI00078652D1|nr:ABC transporter substrate-binding protein [Streptomyces sp. NBRC 109706]